MRYTNSLSLVRNDEVSAYFFRATGFLSSTHISAFKNLLFSFCTTGIDLFLVFTLLSPVISWVLIDLKFFVREYFVARWRNLPKLSCSAKANGNFTT